jgi:uncharacterized protein with WD repeat
VISAIDLYQTNIGQDNYYGLVLKSYCAADESACQYGCCWFASLENYVTRLSQDNIRNAQISERMESCETKQMLRGFCFSGF